jgi:hypothetical protein
MDSMHSQNPHCVQAEEDLNLAFGAGPSSIEIDKMRQQAQQAIEKQQVWHLLQSVCIWGVLFNGSSK